MLGGRRPRKPSSTRPRCGPMRRRPSTAEYETSETQFVESAEKQPERQAGQARWCLRVRTRGRATCGCTLLPKSRANDLMAPLLSGRKYRCSRSMHVAIRRGQESSSGAERGAQLTALHTNRRFLGLDGTRDYGASTRAHGEGGPFSRRAAAARPIECSWDNLHIGSWQIWT